MSADGTQATPLVLVEDVHTYYGKSHILHGVTLEVARARWSACSAATASANRRR